MKQYYNNIEEKEEELKKIEDKIKNKVNNIPEDDRKDKSKVFKYIILSIIIVLAIINLIITFSNIKNKINSIEIIINMSILLLFTIFYIINSLSLNKEKRKIYRIFTTIILTVYYLFLILFNLNLFPTNKTVGNLYNKDISDVTKWAEKNNIKIEVLYEYSDNFEKYRIISQDITPDTLIKKVKKITLVVSDGPNKDKETVIPDMKEWTISQVIDYVEKNHLNNLTIDFEFNNEIEKDLIFEQINSTGTTTRDTEIKLKASLGKQENLTSISMKDLKGLDLFHATTWLGRNAIKYKIEYGYSDKYNEGEIIKQSITKGKIIDKERTKEVIITVAAKNQITIPNIKEMTISNINIWASENKLKLEITEEYDDTIKKDYIISSSKDKGNTVEVGDTIYLVVSKGQIRMPKITSIDKFEEWAQNNNIPYSIEYEFSTTVKEGNIIECSHKENQVIKNTDNINIIISNGGTTTIPNLIGKTKEEAEKICNSNNIECTYNFIESDKEKNIVLSQSMKAGSTVPTNTNIELSISK